MNSENLGLQTTLPSLFDHLPNELWGQIYNLLNTQDLNVASLACKQWHGRVIKHVSGQLLDYTDTIQEMVDRFIGQTSIQAACENTEVNNLLDSKQLAFSLRECKVKWIDQLGTLEIKKIIEFANTFRTIHKPPHFSQFEDLPVQALISKMSTQGKKDQGGIIKGIIADLRKAKQPEQAAWWVQYIPDQFQKDWLCCKIIRDLRTVGQLEKAIELALNIVDVKWQSVNCCDIIDDLIESQRLNEAAELALKICNAKKKSSVLKELVNMYKDKGELDLAIKITHEIPDDYTRSKCYRAHIKVLKSYGQLEKAFGLLKSIPNPYILAAVTLDLIKYSRCNGFLDSLIVWVNSLTDEKFKGQVLHDLVQDLRKAKKFEKAIEVARDISDKFLQSVDYKNIAIDLVESGQTRNAVEVASRISDDKMRSIAIITLVKYLRGIGQLELDEHLIQLIKSIPHEKTRAKLLRSK